MAPPKPGLIYKNSSIAITVKKFRIGLELLTSLIIEAWFSLSRGFDRGRDTGRRHENSCDANRLASQQNLFGNSSS